MKAFIFILLFVFVISCYSQDYLSKESIQNGIDCTHILDKKYGNIYIVPDIKAQFDEAKTSFFDFVVNAEEARKKGYSVLPDDPSILSYNYRLVIGLLIDAKGNIVSFDIKERSMKNKEKKDYTPFEKYVAKRIRKSPRWIPAQCNGKNVMSYLVLHYRMPHFK